VYDALGKINLTTLCSKHNWIKLTLLLAYAALVPDLALAASAGPIENGINWLVQLLTSGIARSIAIIALAILGYMGFAGRLTWDAAFKFIAGIVLIFGGATIVDTFIGAVGGS
jgi:type IV secretion system protein VirB2